MSFETVTDDSGLTKYRLRSKAHHSAEVCLPPWDVAHTAFF